MAKASDILIIVAPGGPATRHIVNAEVLDALGPDGVLVNIARGSLVDEKALIQALRTKQDSGRRPRRVRERADVPGDLIDLDNVVLLPHVGSASLKTRLAMADCLVDNLFAWADGKPPLTPVPGLRGAGHGRGADRAARGRGLSCWNWTVVDNIRLRRAPGAALS